MKTLIIMLSLLAFIAVQGAVAQNKGKERPKRAELAPGDSLVTLQALIDQTKQEIQNDQNAIQRIQEGITVKIGRIQGWQILLPKTDSVVVSKEIFRK
jgi:hypothetical protein